MELQHICHARILPGLGPTYDGLVDLHVRDDQIVGVAPARSVCSGLHAEGATVLPGLWDAHTHFSTHALIGQCLDLSDTESMADVLSVLADQPVTDFVLGFGFRAGTWPQMPSASHLDQAGPHPIVLIAGDLHAVWCNSAALPLIGAPPGSQGYLVEDAAFDAISHVMHTHTSRLDAAVHHAMEQAVKMGVVGIVDMEMSFAPTAWQRRAAAAPLPLRVEAACYASTLETVLEAGWATGTELAPQVTMGALKIIADGSMSTKTAHCTDPYPHPLPHLPHGRANFTQSQLTKLLAKATEGGLQVAVHAIGDMACRDALDAFATTGARGSIEHAQLVADQDLRRFRELGVTASVQPSHLLDDTPLIPEIWPHAGARVYPLRSLLDAGARLSFGSDAPVAPLDPWLAMSTAVHRSHGPGQAISPIEALRASTRGGIAAGEAADLILVDVSPEILLAGGFDQVTVLATVTAGSVVYSKGEGSPAP